MKILLTGSTGMVGRNFLEHPATKSFELLTPGSVELNLCDYFATEAYLKKNQPDIIIHAAGRVGGIQANIKEPVRFLLDNLDMGRNIVWAARQCGVRKLINLGSSCMYPRNHEEPLLEEQVLQGELEPTNEGYALAKVMVSRLCEYISREDDRFQFKTIIPCNLYGRWDKFDPAHSHMIPAVIHKLHNAKQAKLAKVDIWGDGMASREFMYAGDLADCLVQAVQKFDTLPSIMNAGLGIDYTINEYYHAIATVVGFTGSFVHDLSKPVGMQRKLVNITKQKKWGWQATTSLQDGLSRTYQYYLSAIAKGEFEHA